MSLTAPPRLLLVHAHPDDESLWTGGTIARYAAAGVAVTLVTCTLGEEGEIIPAFLRQLAADHADQLGGYRMGELRSACAALGVSDHRYLGGVGRWRDSGMAGAAANTHPRAFVAGDPGTQTAALAEVLAEVDPQVVVTYGPDGGYGHPDHIRAHDITVAALRMVSTTSPVSTVDRLFYTVISRAAIAAGVAELSTVDGLPYRLPTPDELPGAGDTEITTRVSIADVFGAKLAAMRAHASQISVWQNADGAGCYALTNGIATPFVDAEYFVLAQGDRSGADADLFGGLG